MSIPRPYQELRESEPDLIDAYESFAQAAAAAGPLDARTVALVKLAVSLGAGIEGASHSHARKAIDAGCEPAELMHVATLCGPTIGFPPMMRARSWVRDVVGD